MPSIWDYEKPLRSRIRRLASGKGWTRRAQFRGVPSAIVDSLIPPEFDPWPGESGNRAPALVESSVVDDWEQDGTSHRSILTLDYRPLTFMEWLEAHPNHAVLMSSTGAISRKVKTLGGGILDGPDPTDKTGTTVHKVTKGTNTLFDPRPVYDVVGVISDPDAYYWPFVSKVGKYNAVPIGVFPLAPLASRTGQWLFWSCQMSPRLSASKLYNVRYRFLGNLVDNGWAEPCVSTEFWLQATTVNVVDEDGLPIDGATRTTIVLTPQADTEYWLIQPAYFTEIERLLVGSW